MARCFSMKLKSISPKCARSTSMTFEYMSNCDDALVDSCQLVVYMFLYFVHTVCLANHLFVLEIAFQLKKFLQPTEYIFGDSKHITISLKTMAAATKEENFSKRMRKETRDVHKVSDALINAKLAFGMQNFFFFFNFQQR